MKVLLGFGISNHNLSTDLSTGSVVNFEEVMINNLLQYILKKLMKLHLIKYMKNNVFS